MFIPLNRTILFTESLKNFSKLKGAVGTTLCKNETDGKFPMDIYHHISVTEKAGANVFVLSSLS